MRRILAVIAVLAAAATLAASAAGGSVAPHKIADNFSSTSFDPSVWTFWGTGQPDAVTFAQTGGTMNVTVGANAPPDFNGGGETRCSAHGDFDAQVDFALLEWPPANGVWVSLMLGGTPYNVYRVSWQFDPTEQYGAYLPPAGATLPASDTSGTLRLTRRGNVISAYYLSGRTWVPLVSGTGPTGDVPFVLGVFNISGAATFAGREVKVAWDNLRVTADQVVCP